MKKHKNMKTFESCNRVWLTMPEDGKCPLPAYKSVRLLLPEEDRGEWEYSDIATPVSEAIWCEPRAIGWYPVHQDGTDDHATAKLFATGPLFTPRPPRPRITRRRFKLSTKRSIIKHHP